MYDWEWKNQQKIPDIILINSILDKGRIVVINVEAAAFKDIPKPQLLFAFYEKTAIIKETAKSDCVMR